MRLTTATLVLLAAAAAIAGCGLATSAPSSGGSASSSASQAVVVAPAPQVEITTPARGAFLAVGLAAVEGHVTPVAGTTITQVTLGGQTVTPDATGTFRGMAQLATGLNVIQAQCLDSAGNSGGASIGVLAGDYKPDAQAIAHAALVRINNPALDAMAKLAEGAIWQQDWSSLLASENPCDATDFAFIHVIINFSQVRFRDVTAHLGAKPGALGLSVEIAQPVLDCTIEADLGVTTIGPYTAVATADSAMLTTDASFALAQDGSFHSSTANCDVTFQNLQFSVSSSLINTAVQLFATSAIQDHLATWIEGEVTNVLPPKMDQAIAEYLQQTVPWNIYGHPFSLDVRGESAQFDSDGMFIELSMNASGGTPTPQAANAPGSLTTAGDPPQSLPNHNFFASLDDDGFNRCFYAMWKSGCLDIDVDEAFLQSQGVTPTAGEMTAATLKSVLPEIGNAVPDSAPIKLHLSPGLPPVVGVTGQPDLVLLQAGEVSLDVFVDRGNGWEKLFNTVVQVELGAGCTFTPKGLQLTSVGTPTFQFEMHEEPIVKLDDRRIETLLQIVLVPLVPHFLNSAQVIGIPNLTSLSQFSASVYADGPSFEHVSAAGDMAR
jgi:hypothetical protein